MTLIARQDTWRVTFSIDGRNFDVCEKSSGGTFDSEEKKVKDGNGIDHSLGGSRSQDTITISKLYDLDGIGNDYEWIRSRVGRGRVQITSTPVDYDGNLHGKSFVESGVLKSVSRPETDANGSDEVMIEMEITPGA